MTEPLVLTLGEVSGPPPDHVVRAVATALMRNTVRYTPPAGLPAVREAVAASLGVPPGTVVMTTGASGAFLACLTRLARPGANILLPDPGYPGYTGLARRLGVEPRFYPLADGFDDIPTHVLRSLADRDTVAVVIVSPGNPTGHVIPPETVYAVAGLGFPVVVDEVYLDLTGHPAVDPDVLWQANPDSVVLRSYSKSFSLSGLRIGALVARADRAPELAGAHFAAVMSAPATGQVAVLSCLDNSPEEHLTAARTRLRARAAAATEAFGSVPGCRVESGDLGVFAWVRVGDAAAVTERLWRAHRIAVSEGGQFGPSGADHLRILVDVEPAALARVAAALRAEVGLVSHA